MAVALMIAMGALGLAAVVAWLMAVRTARRIPQPASAPPGPAEAGVDDAVSPLVLEQPASTAASPTTPAPNVAQNWRRPIVLIATSP
jgi:hypothetical protein